ncbi:MAG: OmpH family outer membrane protein [Candidatus Omnitrophota bacterium]|nr:MAG: OmpH family outer membrane protein [Candidatus Omnitrophota bacterium]
MRRFVSLMFVVGLITAFSLSCFAADLKIGYVNYLEVIEKYKKTKDYDGELEARRSQEENKFGKRKDKIEKMQDKLSLMAESEQEREKEKLTKEIRSFREDERAVFIDLRKERNEKMNEIVEDINKVIERYAKKNKFDLVIQENMVIFGNKTFDITRQIIKLVNKGYRR